MFNYTRTITTALILGLSLIETANAKRLVDTLESETGVTESPQTDDESDLWTEVKRGGLLDDYQAYLDQYPKGKYSALAKSRIKKLQNESANEARREEQETWEAAEKTGTEEAYQDYLKNHPSGLFAPLVPARLVKIRRETKLRDEESLWQQALGTGTSGAMEAYLEKYPNGRYEKDARLKSEEYQSVPVRPQLPFVLEEEIWRTIEASAAYRNLPQPRVIKTNYQTSDQVEYTGSKSSSLPKPAATSKSVTKEVSRLGGKCAVHRTSILYSQNKTTFSMDVYLCGLIPLGVIMNGKPATITKSIDLQGSLFPMRIGAEQSERAANSYEPDTKYNSTTSNKCRVIGKGLARDVNPKLTGAAWTVSCEMNIQMPAAQMNRTTVTEDYFLEDKGVFLSHIGELDMATKRIVLPVPGSQTAIVAEGEYGSRNTSTYRSHDWTVGD